MGLNRVYLSVASNIQPEANIFAAAEALSKCCALLDVSRCFVTDAIPALGQPPSKDLPYFVNCVILLETGLGARALKFEVLRSLESQLGRVRTADKYAARPIDLDILLFNDEIIHEPQLEIPDPDIVKRWFLAQGILDIDPKVILPNSQDSLWSLAETFFAGNQDFAEDALLRERMRAIA